MIFNKNKPYELPSIVERMRAEDEYFSSPKVLSYSGLKKLAEDPIDFYRHYILNIREDRQDKSTLEGSLTHMLLFNPEEFENEYAVAPSTLPSDNPKMIINKLFELHKAQLEDDPSWSKSTLEDYETEIQEMLTDINLYQSLKDPKARFGKVADDRGKTYWEHLLFAEGKTIIDDETLEKAQLNVERVKSNPELMRLMGMISFHFGDHREVFNEKEYAMFEEDAPFGFRGYLDNLVIDHTEKEIRINDLKNTSKSLLSFQESIELYKYWIQVVIYHKLIEHVYAKRYPEYKRVFRFIVLDRSGVAGAYRVTDETLAMWQKRFETEVMAPAKLHFERKDFTVPAVLLANGEIAI